MFDFRMSVKENFASFRDRDTGKFVYVDSFDNREFNVRLGTPESTRDLGSVVATTDEHLNRRLHDLVERAES